MIIINIRVQITGPLHSLRRNYDRTFKKRTRTNIENNQTIRPYANNYDSFSGMIIAIKNSCQKHIPRGNGMESGKWGTLH